MTHKQIQESALAFARANGARIARERTRTDIYTPVAENDTPISVFMAGSPGAGKTEYSKSIISLLEQSASRRVLRIDGDELRKEFPAYTGHNSHLFQGAISILVDKVHDRALQQNQRFVLDGTFSRYAKAQQNIDRSLKRGRSVAIFYIYQDPLVAWRFVQEREKIEGRHIPKQAFIEQFIQAQVVVRRVMDEYEKRVSVFFVRKDFEKNTVEMSIKLEGSSEAIDAYIPRLYTEKELNRLL